ncbi:hypothetical protein TNCV_2159481 [Trichonephila clavipes]|nr:hypothetical protein TNCV_2159481 [Trichonephila clavipes]
MEVSGSAFIPPTPLGRQDAHFPNHQQHACGRRSLLVKISNLWPACAEVEPSVAEDHKCRSGRCTLNLWSFKRPSSGVEIRRGGCQLRYHPRHFTVVQTYEVGRQ